MLKLTTNFNTDNAKANYTPNAKANCTNVNTANS